MHTTTTREQDEASAQHWEMMAREEERRIRWELNCDPGACRRRAAAYRRMAVELRQRVKKEG